MSETKDRIAMHELLHARLAAHFGGAAGVPAELRSLLEAMGAKAAEAETELHSLRNQLDALQRDSISRTEHARTTQELRARTAEFEAILSSLPDSYARISSNGIFLDFRRPKGRDFVVPVDALRGRHFREALPPDAAQAFQLAMDSARSTGETSVTEFYLPAPQGQLSREARFTPFYDQFIAVFRSTTKDKALQAQLLVADRMASLGTLAAGVGHEINNPLTYVLGNLEWLREALTGLLAQAEQATAREVSEAVAEAYQGAERVAVIARNLRMFTRGDDGGVEPVDIAGVIESALKMTKSELAFRSHVVRDMATVPAVRGSEGRLVQVLVNLLVNAAQALDPERKDNEITVRVRLDPDSRVLVSVRDTGRGIPRATLGRIFDPFFTTKDVGGGTGLGLSICHGIVTSLGGQLLVESEVGRGSEFRVVLPVWLPTRRPRRGRVRRRPARRCASACSSSTTSRSSPPRCAGLSRTSTTSRSYPARSKHCNSSPEGVASMSSCATS